MGADYDLAGYEDYSAPGSVPRPVIEPSSPAAGARRAILSGGPQNKNTRLISKLRLIGVRSGTCDSRERCNASLADWVS